MATCEHCNEDMKSVAGCTVEPMTIGGDLYMPILWGDEPGGWAVRHRCVDCGVQPGGAHHPGCCVERCPACGDQALGCECFWPGKPEIDEDDFIVIEIPDSWRRSA